jgi:hypothetical protein
MMSEHGIITCLIISLHYLKLSARGGPVRQGKPRDGIAEEDHRCHDAMSKWDGEKSIAGRAGLALDWTSPEGGRVVNSYCTEPTQTHACEILMYLLARLNHQSLYLWNLSTFLLTYRHTSKMNVVHDVQQLKRLFALRLKSVAPRLLCSKSRNDRPLATVS